MKNIIDINMEIMKRKIVQQFLFFHTRITDNKSSDIAIIKIVVTISFISLNRKWNEKKEYYELIDQGNNH